MSVENPFPQFSDEELKKRFTDSPFKGNDVAIYYDALPKESYLDRINKLALYYRPGTLSLGIFIIGVTHFNLDLAGAGALCMASEVLSYNLAMEHFNHNNSSLA